MGYLSRAVRPTEIAKTNLDRGHDGFHIFCVELQDAIEDADFVITKGFLAGAMKLEKRLELRLLIRMCFICAKNVI
jgi:hypothetical protein